MTQSRYQSILFSASGAKSDFVNLSVFCGDHGHDLDVAMIKRIVGYIVLKTIDWIHAGYRVPRNAFFIKEENSHLVLASLRSTAISITAVDKDAKVVLEECINNFGLTLTSLMNELITAAKKSKSLLSTEYIAMLDKLFEMINACKTDALSDMQFYPLILQHSFFGDMDIERDEFFISLYPDVNSLFNQIEAARTDAITTASMLKSTLSKPNYRNLSDDSLHCPATLESLNLMGFQFLRFKGQVEYTTKILRDEINAVQMPLALNRLLHSKSFALSEVVTQLESLPAVKLCRSGYSFKNFLLTCRKRHDTVGTLFQLREVRLREVKQYDMVGEEKKGSNLLKLDKLFS